MTHLLAAGAGFALAPRELLKTEVVHNGFFETDTKRVLAAAVESLRSERRLAVYSFKGYAAVSVQAVRGEGLCGRVFSYFANGAAKRDAATYRSQSAPNLTQARDRGLNALGKTR